MAKLRQSTESAQFLVSEAGGSGMSAISLVPYLDLQGMEFLEQS